MESNYDRKVPVLLPLSIQCNVFVPYRHQNYPGNAEWCSPHFEILNTCWGSVIYHLKARNSIFPLFTSQNLLNSPRLVFQNSLQVFPQVPLLRWPNKSIKLYKLWIKFLQKDEMPADLNRPHVLSIWKINSISIDEPAFWRIYSYTKKERPKLS